jgi:hypothetical protein
MRLQSDVLINEGSETRVYELLKERSRRIPSVGVRIGNQKDML